MLAETNALGKTTTYTYNANGFKTSTTDPLNHASSATYNAFGGPLTVTNALSFTQSVTYDELANVRTIADPLGQIAEFTWNPQGQPLTMKDARGNTSSYTYDAYGNRLSQTDAEGRTTRWTYDTFGRKLTETNGRGFTTTYTYDDLGRVQTVKDALNRVTTYEYDANGNKTAEVDALNRRTTFTYDAANRLVRTTYADLTYTEVQSYDFRGKALTVRDQAGRITKHEFDKAGQLRKTIFAFGTVDQAEKSWTYDLAGRKKTETDERAHTTTYNYDDAGRLTATVNHLGKTTAYAYDDANRRRSETNPLGGTSMFDYDSRGRLIKTVHPDTRFVTHSYDGLGARLSTTDQEGKTTAWAYDKAGQLASVTNALNQVTTYGYDVAGNKVRQTDANNRATTYEYDALNRRTKRTLPSGQSETYTWDEVGNLKTRTDFNGRTTTFGYDTLQRLASKTPDPAFTGTMPTSFTYTANGRRATMTDGTGTTTWTYDNRDRVASKATPQGTLTYTWEPNGLVKSVLSSNPNGTSVSYAHDELDRLASVTDNRLPAGANQTNYTYDNASNPLTLIYPNGVVHTFTPDVNNRTAAVNIARAGVTLASFTYTRRLTGHQQSVVMNSGRSTAYTYDDAWRLATESVTGATPTNANGALSYTLDPVGNRLNLLSTLTALPGATYTYNSNDQVVGDTYDANGNTLVSGTRTFGYEWEDRLVTADGGAVTVTYDGDGNRISRTHQGTTTRYLVDEHNPTGWPQVAEELVNGSVVRRYTHGTMRLSQTQLLNSAWTTHWYGYDDLLGSVRQLTDSTGAVSDTYDYDAYGREVAITGTTPNLYRYRGEQFDPALGLYYLRARWYWSASGRFLSADDFEGFAQHPETQNRYIYGNSEPVGNIDPSGFTSDSLVMRAWQVEIDMNVVAASAVASAATTCILTRVWSELDNMVASFGGQRTLPADLLPQCQDVRRTCKEVYPQYINLRQLGYRFRSEGEAFSVLQSATTERLRKGATRTATGGPCSIDSGYIPGRHTNVLFATGSRAGSSAGSIVMCPCCDDSDGNPTLTERYEISNPRVDLDW